MTQQLLFIGNPPPVRIAVRIRLETDTKWATEWFYTLPDSDVWIPRDFTGYSGEMRLTPTSGAELIVPVTMATNVISMDVLKAAITGWTTQTGSAQLWITDSLGKVRVWGQGSFEVVE